MENEKNKKVPAWLGRLCALFTAFFVCAAFCSLAFVRPSMPVKSDFGDFGGYVDYYESAVAAYCSGGFTSAEIASSAFGVAIGTQLALLAIAQQCEIERQQNPGATLNFSDFTAFTGYYQISGDSGYYPMTFPVDPNLNDHIQSGMYPALDGGLVIIQTPHYTAKLFPIGSLSAMYARDWGSYVSFQMKGNTSATVDFIPIGNNDFWNPRYSSDTRSDISQYLYLRYGVGTIPTYVIPTDPTNWLAWRRNTNGNIMCGIPSGVSTTIDDFPDTDVTPETLPDVYNTYILNVFAPQFLIFPDGFPEEDTTEDTSDTTESGDDIHDFTLPPEWLETYTFPLETFPTIPFTDVDTPTFDISDQTEGINFWFVFAKKIFDSNEGLKNFLFALLGIAVAGALLWRLGSHGGDKE